MEESAPKRLKLSPSTVTPSTLKDDGRPTGQDGVHDSRRRASYMSPTKASLARFNPGLLPPVRSIENRDTTARKSPSIRTRTQHVGEEGVVLNGATGVSSRTEKESPTGETNGERGDRGSASTPRNGLSVPPRRRSQTPKAQHTASELPQTQPAPGLRPLPSRNANTAPQMERSRSGNNTPTATKGGKPPNGVTIDNYTMHKLPHTPTRHGIPPGAAQYDMSEPSLPSTPSQLGLEAPYEKPKGLLFGKPIKGSRRKHEGPSPSKMKESTSTQSLVEHSTRSRLGPKIYLSNLPRPPSTPHQVDLQKKIAARILLEKETLTLESSHVEDVLLSSWQNPGAKDTTNQQRQRKRLTELSSKLLRLRQDINQLQHTLGDSVDALDDQTVTSNSAYSRLVVVASIA